MSYGKAIPSLKHCGNRSWHFPPMVTHWHFIKNNIKFPETCYQTAMNDLNSIMLDIFDLFNDFYSDVALIIWATKMDVLALLVEEEPSPYIFNPLQTIGNTNNHVLHQHPHAFLSTSHSDIYVSIAACSHSEDLLIEKTKKNFTFD